MTGILPIARWSEELDPSRHYLHNPDWVPIPQGTVNAAFASGYATFLMACLPAMVEIPGPGLQRAFLALFALSLYTSFKTHRNLKAVRKEKYVPYVRDVRHLPKGLRGDAARMMVALRRAEKTVWSLGPSPVRERLDAQLLNLRSAAWRAFDSADSAHGLFDAIETAEVAGRADLARLATAKLDRIRKPLTDQANRFESVSRSLVALEATLRLHSPEMAYAFREEGGAEDQTAVELRLGSVEDAIQALSEGIRDIDRCSRMEIGPPEES